MTAAYQSFSKHLGMCRVAWVSFALFLAHLSVPAQAVEQKQALLRRWAMICSPEVSSTNLADLLQAELMRLPGLQLLERDEIQHIAEEFVISNLAGDAVQDRLRLGRLLQADGLLVLRILTQAKAEEAAAMPVGRPAEEVSSEQHIQMVLADTRCGARLAQIRLPLVRDQQETLVKQMRTALERVLVRYPSGVELVVGLSPFVSRCLTHDFDYLQDVFPGVIGATLQQKPGVACTELEEAQSIRRELELSGAGELTNLAPLFISGEFRIQAGTQPHNAPVRLLVRMERSGQQEPPIQHDCADTAAALEFLRSRVAATLDLDPGVDATISPARQAKLLLEQADALARIGAFDKSTGLREAALLIWPDADDQPQILISEYERIMKHLHSSRFELKGNAAREAAHRLIVLYGRCLDHLEYLIVNRKITNKLAVFLARRTLQLKFNLRRIEDSPQVLEGLMHIETRRLQFLKQIYPRILELEPQPVEAHCASMWKGSLVWSVIMRCDQPRQEFHEDLPYKLELMLDLLETAGSGQPALSSDMLDFVQKVMFCRTLPHVSDSDRACISQIIERMAKSSIPSNAFLGEWMLPHPTGPLPAEVRLERLRAFQHKYRDLLADRELTSHSWRKMLAYVQANLEAELDKSKSRSLTTTTSSAEVEQEARDAPARHTLCCEPVQIEFPVSPKPRATGPYATWKQTKPPRPTVFKCGDDLDVGWAEGTLGLHVRPGVFVPVAEDEDASYCDAAWDGEMVWIATRKKGIWVVRKTGEIALCINQEHGLPPGEWNLFLCPLAPGRVMAVGSFGKDRRAWGAIIELQAGQPQVSVFYEATRVRLENEAWPSEMIDASYGFIPTWMCLANNYPRAGESRVIIGRDWPMLVDPENLRISILPRRLNGLLYPLDNGDILISSDKHLTHFPVGSSLAEPRTGRLLRQERIRRPKMLLHDGYLYSPGRPWWRIDAMTLQHETLNGPELHDASLSWGGASFSVSAHFGLLVQLYSGEFYQLTVREGDCSSQPATPAP